MRRERQITVTLTVDEGHDFGFVPYDPGHIFDYITEQQDWKRVELSDGPAIIELTRWNLGLE